MALAEMAPAARWLGWAPLAAACAHIFEEFAWPGGFMVWYREYRGPAASRITPRFLMLINTALLIGCWDAAAATDTPVTRAFWLAMCAVLGANGCWHLWAAARTHRYSPGVITGVGRSNTAAPAVIRSTSAPRKNVIRRICRRGRYRANAPARWKPSSPAPCVSD